ncbi:MAG TPA: SIS domain-containing protein [Bryobacteraceae bacterium]|nr:SIS domain-containing protein [Bryobacteraceae bacterium]
MSSMLEEIRHQPDALDRTLERGLREMRELNRRLKRDRPRLVAIAARGTSDNAAQFGRYLIEITTGIPVSLAAPSIVTLYKKGLDLKGALAVAISQSGESTDTNAVLKSARKRGAITVGVTNNSRSAMAQTAEYALLVHAGEERSIAATKTYTGQLLALYLLAAALGGSVRAEELRRIPGCVEAVLRQEARIEETVERYRFMNGTVTVGRGLNYANALEFGLKLMETCYVLAERFSAADLMHGPIAIVERAFPVFVFAPPGPTWPSIARVLKRLGELKADTLAITGGHAKALKWVRKLEVPALPRAQSGDLYTPIPYIIPAQLFAAHLARVKGLNPDRPRTLSKITRTM